MQHHHQRPILSVVSVDDNTTDEDLEREALEDLREVLERHLSRLPASSEWRPAFARMHLAAGRSLSQRPLRLAQPLTG